MSPADTPISSRYQSAKPQPPLGRSAGLAVLGAGSLGIVAWYLVSAGWSDQQAERFLWASTELKHRNPEPICASARPTTSIRLPAPLCQRGICPIGQGPVVGGEW